jgi:hypothetical protein
MDNLQKITNYFNETTDFSGLSEFSILHNRKLNKIIILFSDNNHTKNGCDFDCKKEDMCMDVYCIIENLKEVLAPYTEKLSIYIENTYAPFNIKETRYIESNIYKINKFSSTILPTEMTSRCGELKDQVKAGQFPTIHELRHKFSRSNENFIVQNTDIRQILQIGNQFILSPIPAYFALHVHEYLSREVSPDIPIDLYIDNIIKYIRSGIFTGTEVTNDHYIKYICRFVTEEHILETIKQKIQKQIDNIVDISIKTYLHQFYLILSEILTETFINIKKTKLYSVYNSQHIDEDMDLFEGAIDKYFLYPDMNNEQILDDLKTFFKYFSYFDFFIYFMDLYTIARMHRVWANNPQSIIIGYYGGFHVKSMVSILLKCEYVNVNSKKNYKYLKPDTPDNSTKCYYSYQLFPNVQFTSPICKSLKRDLMGVISKHVILKDLCIPPPPPIIEQSPFTESIYT